ncbi:MAG: hypothetical protein OK441_01370 [Thaumarchaeota archaeon]|nr:hypothetical protein [Nitrososphaerota archaeon]
MSTTAGRVPEQTEVLWVGHPWVVPRFVGATIILLALGVMATWAEFTYGIALRSAGPVSLLLTTYGAIGIVWLIIVISLLILRASYKYVLRQSSMDIARGIITKKTYTLSAAGFSDLEVIQGVGDRLLNMGAIVMETDSRKDLRLIMIRDPTRVASRIKQVMTTPMVRLAPEITTNQARTK